MNISIFSLHLLLLCIVFGKVLVVFGQECTADGKKCDTHERCSAWREEGECVKNRTYMLQHCPASCALEDAATGFDPTYTGECKDKHKFCSVWAEHGECEENKFDMEIHCRKSCGVCESQEVEEEEDDQPNDDFKECRDEHENCEFWASAGECEVNSRYMEISCAKSCNTCQKLEPLAVGFDTSRYEKLSLESEKFGTKQKIDGDQHQEVAQVIQESIHYLEDPQTKQLPTKVLSECKNRNELCAFWALIGECDNNKAYMITNCAPSCKSCNLIDIQNRCPPLADAKPALYPGSLNKMFYNILENAPGNRTDLTSDDRRKLAESQTPEYFVHVHSRPGNEIVSEISAAMDKSLPPWVVTFENFLTDAECDELIKLGHKYDYKRSEDVGAEKFDGSHDSVRSESRTSENAWCSGACRDDEVPKRVQERIASVLNIPAENSEDLQILKYEKGQYYRTHHDFIDHQVDRQCGPRILTFFLYLSDVEEGGGTNFPQLDITIYPKRGRALLWPSVLNSDPLRIDRRTSHQALDVEKGLKFAANGWVHMYNYIDPQNRGCT